MCGICGEFSYAAGDVNPDTVLRMTSTMAHRGPDADGTYLSPDRRVGFGHRRLSIIDLSEAGRQPMCNEDRTVWITFNGEIYNHDEVRRELVARGHVYHSRTDTETIVHAYEEWGVEAIHRLHGMFAFAIWDERRGKMLLVRDRIGIKPLYFRQDGGRLLFGSEIKAILAHPAVTPDLDEEAAFHYLSFMVTPAPMTMFAGIRKLPAGHYMEIDGAGNAKVVQYWDVIPDPAKWTPVADEHEAVETVQSLLRSAVEKRMMSDVPFGVFLSGGIDSSTNVALMSQASSLPVRTFTVGYKDDGEFNELQYARRVAQDFGTEHHEILIDEKDFRDFVPQLIYHQDEPIADWVCVPLYYVSKLLRDSGTIVVQVGEGADELFCGYPGYLPYLSNKADFYRKYLRLPRWMRRGVGASAEALGSAWEFPPFPLNVLGEAGRSHELFWSGAALFRGQTKRRLTAPWAMSRLDSFDAIKPYYDRFDEMCPAGDPLNRMVYQEFKLRLPELLLMRVDKMTMGVSVEARVPFLDHLLVEYAFRIPQSLKLKDGVLKSVLKKAVRGLIPDEIIDRKKQGFGVPGQKWMEGYMDEYSRDAIFNSSLRERKLFDYDFVDALFRHSRDQAHVSAIYIWTLVNFSLWYDHWVARTR